MALKSIRVWGLVVVSLMCVLAVGAQVPPTPGGAGEAVSASAAGQGDVRVTVSVLRLIKFSGSVADAHGAPLHGTVGVTFALYTEQQGGVPLWLETQNVQLDSQGRYTALLGAGSNEGLPLEIFASGEARWLGITVQGQPEQARVLLVAVPYALKAADAETLGGRPPSAFVLAAPPIVNGTETMTGETTTSTSATGGSAVTVSGTTGRLAKFTAADAVGDSVLFEDGTGKVGLGTTTPVEQLDISGPSRTRINMGNQSTVQFASTGFSLRLNEVAGPFTQWEFFAEKNAAGAATGQTTFQIRRHNDGQTEAVTPFLIDKDTNVILESGFKAGTQIFGNVGIGTAAPTQKLQVLGNVRITGAGNGLIFNDASKLTTAAGLGDITAVTTAAGSGLTGGAASGAANLSLLTSCATGQLLKWSGTQWQCEDDVGGGGTVTSVGSGTGLTGGPITSSGTLSVDTAVVPRLGVANTFTTGTQVVQTGAAGTLGLAVRGAVSQTTNLQEWQNSAGTPLASVNAGGGITAASFTGNGSALTSLNASNLASGAVADARLSSNVALRNGNNTFTGNQVIETTNTALAVSATGASAVGLQVASNDANGAGAEITNSGGGEILSLSNGTFVVLGVDHNGILLRDLPFVGRLPNDTTTGTTLNKLVKWTTLNQVVTLTTSDTGGAIGVVVSDAGKTGEATFAWMGEVHCVFDGPATVAHYVQISTTVAGDCHDAGASYPSSGGQILGRVLNPADNPPAIWLFGGPEVRRP